MPVFEILKSLFGSAVIGFGLFLLAMVLFGMVLGVLYLGPHRPNRRRKRHKRR